MPRESCYLPRECADDGLEDIEGVLVSLLASQQALEDAEEGFQLALGLDFCRSLGDNGCNESGQGWHIASCLPRARSKNGLDEHLEIAGHLVRRAELEQQGENLEDEGDEFCD